MENVIVYVRYDSHAQDDANGVAAQTAYIEEYGRLHNMEIEKYYIDTDKTDRSEYRQMLEDITTKKVKAKTVLVKTIDRLHRNMTNALGDIVFFDKHNVRLIGIMDGIDTTAATENYSDLLSKNIRAGLMKSAKKLVGEA